MACAFEQRHKQAGTVNHRSAHSASLFPRQVLRCTRIATAKAAAITDEIRKAVEAHEVEQQQKKVKRHAPALATGDLVLSGADLHPQVGVKGEVTQETVVKMEVEEGLNEEDTDEEEESESGEELEEDEKVPVPSTSQPKKVTVGGKGGGAVFSGGASTWLEEDDVTQVRGGRKRDWRRERPAAKGTVSGPVLGSYSLPSAGLLSR